MNTPKITRRKCDGIWMIAYNVGEKRKRRSLGTKDEMTARIKFNEDTGQPTPSPQVIPTAAPVSYLPEEPKVTYVDAINQFMLSTYGIKDAWSAKRKPQCHK